MELKLVETKSKEIDEKFYKYEMYRIGDYKVEVNYCNGVRNNIEVEEDCKNRFAPIIYFERNRWSEDKTEKFKIQTAAYGALGVDEIQKVIDGFQQAMEIVAILTEKFL